MLVSWKWLSDYVRLDMSVEQLQTRLMMAGLNHEGTERVGDDLAVDLEVTSNRPDCLGHLGIAREIAVLWDQSLRLPPADPEAGPARVGNLACVTVECPELCNRYSARVIRGVRIGPSPQWLINRLHTIGVAPINNVVDITNFVLMECGQPLHAFDFARLNGGRIVVRASRPGETFLAIDHKTYALEPGMCVIASGARAVAVGGVMGGAETEVSAATTDVLLESACFDPLSVRNTARRLNLHSPSSFRFERGVDWEGIDWASRRCCALILELAGGELAEGVVDVAVERVAPEPIVLRWSQLKRVLGIELDPAEVRRILRALGNRERRADGECVEVIPPSWRQDLTREIDLVEEVIRIHGYDRIAEDVGVPMVASRRSDCDRVLERVHRVLTAAGFNEAITLSAVEPRDASIASPWCDAPLLRCAVSLPCSKGAIGCARACFPVCSARGTRTRRWQTRGSNCLKWRMSICRKAGSCRGKRACWDSPAAEVFLR
jgi:phenylalanyl-tRNA synthetase beta chain